MARMDGDRYAAAFRVVVELRALGHAAFFAGGCVRDMLLRVEAKDFDVATSARPEEVRATFAKTEAVGAAFGVVLVIEGSPKFPPGLKPLDLTGDDVRAEARSLQDEEQTQLPGRVVTEVATFRNDGAYTDGRRPDAVRFSDDPREDVLRRDFTINGLLLDAVAFEAGATLEDCVLDFVGGREDLRAGVVRAIGEPSLRFGEDKLRMLRAVRFAARLGFAVEERTMAAIRAQAAEIAVVSAERVREELTKILTEGHARRGFELLDASGLLVELLPEVARMKGVEQPAEFHPEGDVWVHTLMLLEQLGKQETGDEFSPGQRQTQIPFGNDKQKKGDKQEKDDKQPVEGLAVRPTLAWGMLLHDVGKPATFTPPDPAKAGDRIRFNGHVEVGLAVARGILTRLRFSNEDAAQVLALVQHHMQFGDVMRMKQSTLKRFLRLPKFEEHLALHRADCLSSHGGLGMYDFARQQFAELGEEAIRPKLLLAGADLIAAGYTPGPGFKAMLEAAEDAQLEGRVKTTEEALELVRQVIGNRK